MSTSKIIRIKYNNKVFWDQIIRQDEEKPWILLRDDDVVMIQDVQHSLYLLPSGSLSKAKDLVKEAIEDLRYGDKPDSEEAQKLLERALDLFSTSIY